MNLLLVYFVLCLIAVYGSWDAYKIVPVPVMEVIIAAPGSVPVGWTGTIQCLSVHKRFDWNGHVLWVFYQQSVRKVGKSRHKFAPK